jgi:hypothetical protein
VPPDLSPKAGLRLSSAGGPSTTLVRAIASVECGFNGEREARREFLALAIITASRPGTRRSWRRW